MTASFGPIASPPTPASERHRFQRSLERPYELEFWRGQYNLAARNYGKAIEHFQRGLAMAPDVGPAHYGLAEAGFWQNDWELAATHYARAAELEHEPGLSHKGLGWCRFQLKQDGLALAAWREALAQFRDDVPAERVHAADARMGMALAMVRLGRCAEAAEEYAAAQDLSGTITWPQGWFGSCKQWLEHQSLEHQ